MSPPSLSRPLPRIHSSWPPMLFLLSAMCGPDGRSPLLALVDAQTFNVCGADYNFAAANCRTNAPCPGGDAGECPMNELCYVIPLDQCPSLSPTAGPTTTPDLFVCGANLFGAVLDCRTGGRCDSLPCADGLFCFKVSANICPTLSPTTPPTPPPTFPPTPPPPTTHPTSAPSVVPPPRICGEDIDDAANNCATNPGCPTGDADTMCPIGYGCFEIVECLVSTAKPITSPPTAKPITSTPTAKPITSTPTAKPTTLQPTVTNDRFCGATYNEASTGCNAAQACPQGNECPPEAPNCFVNIVCDTPAPTGHPTYSGPRPTNSPTSTSPPSARPTSSSPPTKTVTDLPTRSPTANRLFCGENYGDAETKCSVGTACPNGFECPSNQICYTGIVCVYPTDSPTTMTPTTHPTTPYPTPPPTFPLTARRVGGGGGGVGGVGGVGGGVPTPFDPNNKLYCGLDYADAQDNCYDKTPCPNSDPVVCPDVMKNGALARQNCFPEIVCEIPPKSSPVIGSAPTPSPIGTGTRPVEGPAAIIDPSSSDRPTMDWENLGTVANLRNAATSSFGRGGVFTTAVGCALWASWAFFSLV